MKKVLCLLLALTAVCCFAGCTDGKCDECKTEKNVEVYEDLDGKEYCPSCAAEAALHKGIDNLFGDKD
ncbi:MAG: hypothetical protein IJX75_00660 [Clostridia bacterium]|nr:hypothetical protein [Clostridia bacterium]